MTDLTLNDGRTMPQLGMGTWQIPDSQVAAIVRNGLDIGFRLVDTAAIYENERGVGDGYKGSDAFLTTKLWNDRQGDPEAALDESLALLGLDAVDLYLMHWPAPGQGQFVDAWKAMVALRDAGKTRSIGVSNFEPAHLDAIVAATGVTPVVNQIELHPNFQQREARAYHERHGIVTQSWSPLGQGKTLLTDARITDIAAKHGRSAAQVILAWHLALGLSVIPKASDAEHLTDNFAALDLTLDDEDMAAIAAMDDAGGRMGPEPGSM
ncbi:aldo/keto reductase [Sphingomonas ginsenosidivorax]|uniref:Aldo/keto reductase n=1 Tax=Sphingomonas ginsenosidivorax TaxID=862135 RepID=A0A5C6UHP6_9SPHN|nr:aldo/keto reductase [Sphingomonas ginsenosidivorax]TXC71741.1 aldo/keto reductase [Sphingomonas ginsenosidivorax]